MAPIRTVGARFADGTKRTSLWEVSSDGWCTRSLGFCCIAIDLIFGTNSHGWCSFCRRNKTDLTLGGFLTFGGFLTLGGFPHFWRLPHFGRVPHFGRFVTAGRCSRSSLQVVALGHRFRSSLQMLPHGFIIYTTEVGGSILPASDTFHCCPVCCPVCCPASYAESTLPTD